MPAPTRTWMAPGLGIERAMEALLRVRGGYRPLGLSKLQPNLRAITNNRAQQPLHAASQLPSSLLLGGSPPQRRDPGEVWSASSCLMWNLKYVRSPAAMKVSVY
jgi:hypothetical protein